MSTTIINTKLFPILFWLLFCMSLLIFSSGISWKLNSAVHFTYSTWYQVLDIKSHIKTYAPQNKYNKQDFVNTTSEQHYSLFSEVVVAINNQGSNLDKINYTINSREKKLFTKSEVTHLEDVSILINKLTWVWRVNLILLGLLCFVYFKHKITMPSTRLKLQVLTISTAAITFTFLLLGFKRIFYYFHTLVFPNNHQWFFYYQESLMSTFMKAPDLFAAMGLNLLFVAIIAFILMNYLLTKKLKKQ